MKKLLLFAFSAILLVSCKEGKTEVNPEEETMAIAINYEPYGDQITSEGAIDGVALRKHFEALKPGDTLTLKIQSSVAEVCQKKGCWVKLGEGEDQVMMRFKDYAFFMPKDLAGKTIIAEGKAYLEELSVEAQQHYAEDGGATPEEIAAITSPKLTYSFKAHGVLVPESENH
ncbi:MAG TPA: DUF4920 domain-containing protein [Flavobacteriaceae bacterium]|nr:DUF4920 domain-containing protein [Flavobacteriaceae bacterium]